MVFNGHTKASIDAIDEITMNEITVMYADGVIGNQGLLITLGSLVAGVFNYTRAPSTPAYTLKSILGNIYGYIFPETKEDPSNSLLNFMTQSQGFSMDKFTKD